MSRAKGISVKDEKKVIEIRLSFAYFLKQERPTRTQVELSKLLGVTQGRISQYMNIINERFDRGELPYHYDVSTLNPPKTIQDCLRLANELEDLEQTMEAAERNMDEVFAKAQAAEKVENSGVEQVEAPTVETQSQKTVAERVNEILDSLEFGYLVELT